MLVSSVFASLLIRLHFADIIIPVFDSVAAIAGKEVPSNYTLGKVNVRSFDSGVVQSL